MTVRHERVPFRLIYMPCCHHQVCWVNPRLPNHCPDCGTNVMTKVKENIMFTDEAATLAVNYGPSFPRIPEGD